MPRAIRDPIHGNVPIGDVAGAVIDTLAFQRLRYVRQNGLLHFVFPGATHTRFAHSIGAMHVASRTWQQLERNFQPSKERDYVGAIFELGALLHDVGHCAFSHSIESIDIKGKPLLGGVKEFFESWDQPELMQSFLKAKAAKDKNAGKKSSPDGGPIKHEQIGLLLAKRIFTEPNVDETCTGSLGVDGATVAADVIALMQLGVPATKKLKSALAAICAAATTGSFVAAKSNDFVRDMTGVLAGLISGTLDVDRMDYLLRDSFYCGVSYGHIDIEHIIGGLGLASFKGRTYLTIKEKAVLAVDDLLWSRHQMFLQVYGHKTNVALNRMLQLAIPDMMGDLEKLNPPRTYAEYLEFTDDFLLSRIFSLCFHGKRLGETTSYARLLARREIPEHLGELRLPAATKDLNAPEITREQGRWAQKRHVAPSDVLTAISANEIIKEGPLPSVVILGDREGEFELGPFKSRSSLFGMTEGEIPLPARYATAHFFIERPAPVAQTTDSLKPDAPREKIPSPKIEKLPKKAAALTKKRT